MITSWQQSVFQQYHSEKHLPEFYPQDGGESQLALKLRHCHPMYKSALSSNFRTELRTQNTSDERCSYSAVLCAAAGPLRLGVS